MRQRGFGSLGMLTLVLAVLALVPVPVAGQTSTDGRYIVPRTVYGQPDLQGVWANNTATPMERLAAFEGKNALTNEEFALLKERAAEVRSGEEAGNLLGPLLIQRLLDPENAPEFDAGTGNYNSFWLVERELDNRTSLIVDPPNGRIPSRTEEAKSRSRRRRSPGGPAGPEDLSLNVRCITYGVSNLLAGYNSYFQIMQAKDRVVVYQELIHDARVIPLDGRPHLNEEVRLWHGDSRAYYDGDTLVVETRNYSKQGSFRGASENLQVVERFTRVSADTIAYEVTFEDPTTWTSPWTAMIPLKQSEGTSSSTRVTKETTGWKVFSPALAPRSDPHRRRNRGNDREVFGLPGGADG